MYFEASVVTGFRKESQFYSLHQWRSLLASLDSSGNALVCVVTGYRMESPCSVLFISDNAFWSCEIVLRMALVCVVTEYRVEYLCVYSLHQK